VFAASSPVLATSTSWIYIAPSIIAAPRSLICKYVSQTLVELVEVDHYYRDKLACQLPESKIRSPSEDAGLLEDLGVGCYKSFGCGKGPRETVL
jgi:hypothetical protein